MAADFMNDAEYVELCGSKKVLEVVSMLDGIFDRHNFRSYEAKKVGRVIDPAAIKKEISCLQPILEESSRLFGCFWKTALYLQERESAVQKYMERLRKQEKEQERLRVAFKAFARGPTLPKEITDMVLNHNSTTNRLTWRGQERLDLYVNGLLPLAVYKPSLLLPHYKGKFSERWTLFDIALEELEWTVLEDASLTNHISLYMNVHYTKGLSSLRPLMKYPHQWKKLSINVEFVMDDFVDVFGPCLPHLKVLRVDTNSVVSSGVVLPPGSCHGLKLVDISFNAFSDFYNSGIMSSVTRLKLYLIDSSQFPSHDIFKKVLNDLPLVLSRLSCLRELTIRNIHPEGIGLEGSSRVHSSSLRSLEVYECSEDTAMVFLNLFEGCSIDRIVVDADALEEADRLFGNARRVGFWEDVPDILFQRKQDGSLAFPRMKHMELSYERRIPGDRILQHYDNLLRAVRMRYDDPVVCRISNLRIPSKVVANQHSQDELERYVTSLVLYIG